MYAYVDGVQTKLLGYSGTANVFHPFSGSVDLLKGESLSIRSDLTRTLLDDDVIHHLAISSAPDFHTFGVSGPYVDSSGARSRIVSAYIANSGTPTVTNQLGSWITSLTDNSIGDTTIVIPAGIFGSTPHCTCSAITAGAVYCSIDDVTVPSTTAIRTQTITSAGAGIDEPFFIICNGERP